MNAVAAVYGAADQRAARAAVALMLNRMPRRAAGHRSSLADESGVVAAAGKAPAFASKADYAILAGDLRLDNAPELRAALGLPAGTADATLALEAFAKWGDDFARRLAGDFAFVILDRRERRLLAVRDALGIRPLFYRLGTDHMRCASELAALVEPGDRPDEGYLAEMLTGDPAGGDATPFLSVRRVPAAHVLIASRSGVKVVRYWEPPREPLSGTLEEHGERFRDVFDTAVRACCAGHAQPAVHLSGGLDSSSVLGAVCAAGLEPIAGSLVFPWPEADEREWIAVAARHWSIEPILVAPAVTPAAHDLHAIAAHADIPDYPTGGPMLAPLHAALRERGAGVVLTGFGGDQWWSGETAYMADLLRRGRLGALRRWHAAGASIGDEVQWSWQTFARDGVLPLVPNPLKRAVRHFAPAPLPSWIDRAFARRVDLRARLRRRPDTSGAPSESWRRMRWRLDSGGEAFAREKLDLHAVASGIELRHPLQDRRLVELAFALPESARIGVPRNRAAMRLGMGPDLPPAIAARVTKADISAVLVSALGGADVQPHLTAPRLADLGWIDPAGLADLAARVAAGDSAAAGPLWRVIGIEAWLNEMFGAR